MAHLLAGFRRNALANRIAGALENPIGKRLRPKLGKAPQGPCVGVGQFIDIGHIKPQIGKWVERLARVQGLRKKHGVDPARTRAGKDVGQNAQMQPAFAFNQLKQTAIHARNAAIWVFVAGRGFSIEVAACAGQVPQLFGYAVHIYGKANAAVTDQGNSEFFLAHVGIVAG